MMRKFTIELMVDFEDLDKLPHMLKACQLSARHLLAQAEMIRDEIRPQIAIISEDFFNAPQSIAMFDDVVGQGAAMVGTPGEADEISAELLAAIQGVK